MNNILRNVLKEIAELKRDAISKQQQVSKLQDVVEIEQSPYYNSPEDSEGERYYEELDTLYDNLESVWSEYDAIENKLSKILGGYEK